MAANTGVTLAKIRAGTASFKEDNATFSEEIKAVQKALELLGFWGSPAEPDGVYGAFSVAAVRGFQNEHGLSTSGVLDKATLAKLETAMSFSLYGGHSQNPSRYAILMGFDYAGSGSSGSIVTTIRSYLIQKGYSVTATGAFDSALASVVKQFQKANSLSQDGNVGQQTFLVLSTTSTSTNWFTNNQASLSAAHLARCGFSGAILNRNITELNSALHRSNINTKEKVKHFLAQCMAETVSGTRLVEYNYQAGRGAVSGVKYSPYYGGGYLHLTWPDAYQSFFNYMKTKGTTDAKIYTPAAYATQHVAYLYPGRSAGWYWSEYKHLNDASIWSQSAKDICTQLTKAIYGSEATSDIRLGHYNKISAALK